MNMLVNSKSLYFRVELDVSTNSSQTEPAPTPVRTTPRPSLSRKRSAKLSWGSSQGSSKLAHEDKDTSLVLFAPDTPTEEYPNGGDLGLKSNMDSGKNHVKVDTEKQIPDLAKYDDLVPCSDISSSPILDLSDGLLRSPEEGSEVTPATSTKQYALLMEHNANVSISEEKLGFSLPDGFQSRPELKTSQSTILDVSDSSDDFKTVPRVGSSEVRNPTPKKQEMPQPSTSSASNTNKVRVPVGNLINTVYTVF